MQFLIISDSHGHADRINTAIERVGRIDGIFFLGDGVRDIDYVDARGVPIYAVRGNCDILSGETDYPEERLVTVGQKNIFMCHGHRYGVKYSLDNLIYAAEEKNADIVIFGHTHKAFECRFIPDDYKVLSKPVYFFNPGSLSGYDASFGVLNITHRGEILLSHGQI